MASDLVILVVEDEILIQQMIEDALADGGFSVSFASRGDEALGMLESDGESYRALITDINLPGSTSGWEVAKRAREINEQLPVIYITGDSANEWASKGVPKSVLLMKPFAVAQMITAVSQLITESGQLP